MDKLGSNEGFIHMYTMNFSFPHNHQKTSLSSKTKLLYILTFPSVRNIIKLISAEIKI